MKKRKYIVEVTDTYGGEANYSWIKRFVVSASSMRGAVNKIGRVYARGWKQVENYGGGSARYNLKNACICMFVEWVDENDAADYLNNHGFVTVI